MQYRHVPDATIEVPDGAAIMFMKDGDFELGPQATTTDGLAMLVGVPPEPLDIGVHVGAVTYRPWTVTVRASTYTESPRHP